MRPDPIIRLYVTVDETGNLGKSTPRERNYVVVACLVKDRHRFEEVSRREAMRLGREVKFNTDPQLREKVIRAALPYVEDVYYAMYTKERSIHNVLPGLTSEYRHDIHMRMIRALADAIIRQYEGGIVVDVDANSLVRDYEVVDAFENNPYIDGSRVKCDVRDSRYNFGLQTNDFFVGAIGQMVNGPITSSEEYEESNRWVKLFRKKPKQVHLRNKKGSGYR